MTGGSDSPVGWRDELGLLRETKEDILLAVHEVERKVDGHEGRISTIENAAKERKAVQTTTAFYLGLPKAVAVYATSILTLVLLLIAAWSQRPQ
jgi:hypothetical protein